MAAQYDALGNYLGDWETEEERRKREEEERQRTVQTQTIETAADGSQTVTTERQLPPPTTQGPGIPQPSGAVAYPVTPQQVFGNILRAESNNRQFTPSGQVVTSPKGAMGAAQIMPATAAQPGFGVPSIFDLAEQRGIQVPNRDEATARQLLANEQLNREFGQLYSNAMQQRFGQQGGVAAYNAGPGRVERNVAANQGQLNLAQLPQETQGYMQNVLKGLGNVVGSLIPSAQAGTLPQGQAQQAPTVTAPQTRTAINPETGETYQQLVPAAPPGGAPAVAGPCGRCSRAPGRCFARRRTAPGRSHCPTRARARSGSWRP